MKSLLGLLILVPLGAAAADITVSRLDDPVPNGCGGGDCSLREAVLFANGSPGADRILLPASASPYQLTQTGAGEEAGLSGDLDINGALEIAGVGPTPAVIVQTTNDRVIDVNGVAAPTVLRNVHVRGGRGVFVGGGVVADGSPLVVVDSEFTDNAASDGGGAIAVRCANASASTVAVSVTGSRFEDNSALEGGALDMIASATNNCTVTIDTSIFVANSAVTLGGAVAVNQSLAGSLLDIRDSTFSGNVATADAGAGGAIGMGSPSSYLRITDSDFVNNRATGSLGSRGGAVLNATEIVGSLFLANKARRGGAVATDGAEVRNSTFCDNEALSEGGALYATRAQVRRSMFCRNSALVNGGAASFSALAGDDVTIERSTFDANIAPTGGAISMADGELRMSQSTLASVDVPAPGSTGTVLRYSGPQAAANGSLVQLTGNILRGTCSFANGIATVNLARHNANSGGNTCGLLQSGAQFTNNITFTTLGGIPLDPLAYNGGPTLTRLLGTGAGHPARGRVPLAQCLDPDQRYFFTTDAACDAGAAEVDGAPDAIFASGFEG